MTIQVLLFEVLIDNVSRIHAGKTVPIVKGGEQTKMEENEVDIEHYFNAYSKASRFTPLKLSAQLERVMCTTIWTAHTI